MGAVSVVIRKRVPAAYYKIVDITGSASYATGGDTYTNAQFEAFSQVDCILADNASGYVLVADLPNKKIKFMRPGVASSVLVEETATTSLTGITARCVVF